MVFPLLENYQKIGKSGTFGLEKLIIRQVHNTSIKGVFYNKNA